MNPCIHGKIGCEAFWCRKSYDSYRVIKKNSISLLCGYHMSLANRSGLVCILDSTNCEECKSEGPMFPSNVIFLNRRHHVR